MNMFYTVKNNELTTKSVSYMDSIWVQTTLQFN